MATPNRMPRNAAMLLPLCKTWFSQDAFTAWAKKNRTDFYKIAARLIPTQMEGGGDDGEHVVRIIHDAR